MSCGNCNDGMIVVCVDDMCRGAGECFHGDGMAVCPCQLEPDCDYDDDGPVTCRCGRAACAEACEQCGDPLCPMCFELGAGFCDKHPDDEYRPPEGTHYAEG